MGKYLAIIKDSFREALSSRVLWLVLVLITMLLLAVAPLGYHEELTWRLSDSDVREWQDFMVVVRDAFKLDVFSGHLFVFFSKRRDRVRVVYWDRDGIAMWTKRLERARYRLQRNDVLVRRIDAAELSLILEGIDLAKVPAVDPSAIDDVPTAEEIVARFPDPPAIEHLAQPRAFYRPSTDSVTMPPRSAFERTEGYYSTLFHELTHATGHAKRLARPGFDKNHASPFGSEPYAREELVAELGAAFLCGEAGLEPDISNSAAYIDHWRQQLSRDSRLVITAAQQAQRAADFILGRIARSAEESESHSVEGSPEEEAA